MIIAQKDYFITVLIYKYTKSLQFFTSLLAEHTETIQSQVLLKCQALRFGLIELVHEFWV